MKTYIIETIKNELQNESFLVYANNFIEACIIVNNKNQEIFKAFEVPTSLYNIDTNDTKPRIITSQLHPEKINTEK